jgi:uncharacterized protein (AIM24 family)
LSNSFSIIAFGEFRYKMSAYGTDNIEPVPVVPTFFVNIGVTERIIEQNDLFQVLGDFCQIVHLKLAPNQTIQAEPGTMCYMSDNCQETVKLGGIGRLLMDGSLMKGCFQNKDTQNAGFIGLTGNAPGNIIPINLDIMGGAVKAKRDSFLAAFDSSCRIKLATISPSSCGGCLCADTPFFLQEISAKGWVFLNAHGTIMQKELRDGEEIVVDGNSFVACSMSVKVDARRSGTCATMLCGGEGMFNTALKGPGLVILCSLPMDKLRKLFMQPNTRPNPKNKPKTPNA